jgi:carbonic anhydrase
MDKLRDGVRYFRDTIFPRRRESFEILAKGQSPEHLFITCADSRIVPELITQTEPGDLFVARNPGALVPPYDVWRVGGVLASVEYAVSVLGVKHIIVCGHSECGAMKGVLQPDGVAHLPAVARWLEATAQARERLESEGRAGDVRRMTELTVLLQLENLRTHPAVRDRLDTLTLHGWIYSIASGEIDAWDPARGEFRRWPE